MSGNCISGACGSSPGAVLGFGTGAVGTNIRAGGRDSFVSFIVELLSIFFMAGIGLAGCPGGTVARTPVTGCSGTTTSGGGAVEMIDSVLAFPPGPITSIRTSTRSLKELKNALPARNWAIVSRTNAGGLEPSQMSRSASLAVVISGAVGFHATTTPIKARSTRKLSA
jgi:hypothetical protein